VAEIVDTIWSPLNSGVKGSPSEQGELLTREAGDRSDVTGHPH
jgi:hypothetical protein